MPRIDWEQREPPSCVRLLRSDWHDGRADLSRGWSGPARKLLVMVARQRTPPLNRSTLGHTSDKNAV